MEELGSLKRGRVRSAVKLTSSGEMLDDKLVNQPLAKGLLLEFKKDSERILLAVAQRPDGKKNWMVHDQVLVETTRMEYRPLSNHNKLHMLFQVLKILTIQKFQALFRKLMIIWIRHCWSLHGLSCLKRINQ